MGASVWHAMPWSGAETLAATSVATAERARNEGRGNRYGRSLCVNSLGGANPPGPSPGWTHTPAASAGRVGVASAMNGAGCRKSIAGWVLSGGELSSCVRCTSPGPRLPQNQEDERSCVERTRYQAGVSDLHPKTRWPPEENVPPGASAPLPSLAAPRPNLSAKPFRAGSIDASQSCPAGQDQQRHSDDNDAGSEPGPGPARRGRRSILGDLLVFAGSPGDPPRSAIRSGAIDLSGMGRTTRATWDNGASSSWGLGSSA